MVGGGDVPKCDHFDGDEHYKLKVAVSWKESGGIDDDDDDDDVVVRRSFRGWRDKLNKHFHCTDLKKYFFVIF